MIAPQRIRQHDAIEAVKPLSPPDLRATASSLAWGSELWSVLPRYYGFITDGGFNVLEMDHRFFAEQKKAQETRIRKSNELALSTSC